MKSIYSYLFFSGTLVVLLNACSVLVGQVQPVEEHAPKSHYTDVSILSPNWKKLDIPAHTRSEDDVPDAAWQSTTTAAVISLNSACRQNPDENVDLKEVTGILLSQWDNLKILSETNVTVSKHTALETEAEGKYLGRDRKFKTVVVKTSTCVYDLVYLSPIKSFTEELSVFDRFRDSLNLK
jgi:hypothetical protein